MGFLLPVRLGVRDLDKQFERETRDGFFSCVVWFVTNESSILRNSYVGYLTKN